MIYHILNGDALTEGFKSTLLTGEILIMRESMIEGDLNGNTLEEYIHNRLQYLNTTYPQAVGEYPIAALIDKVIHSKESSEFNLWFGYDLFCQVHVWFLLSLMKGVKDLSVYLIYPSYLSVEKRWEDFGRATPDDLKYCFSSRVLLEENDFILGHDLWRAYSSNHTDHLKLLSGIANPHFPYLEEVCIAQLERQSTAITLNRPEKIVSNLISIGVSDFETIFIEFNKSQGVYGFGDVQLQRIYDKVKSRLDPA